MAKSQAVSDDELKSIVRAELANCDGLSGSQLANDRAENLDYYFGRPFGNELEGRSQVVSPDVRDAVEWTMPTLMRIFTSGENVVEFQPEEEKDVEASKQATEYANFVWNRDNPGWKNFYTWFKDGLLSKNGVIKIYWNKTEQTKRERYSGLDDATFAQVVNQPDVTVSEHTETDVGGVKYHDLVLTKKMQVGRVCIDTIPPEEFLISQDARCSEEARLEGHKRLRTLSDLIEDGYDKDKVNDLVSDESASTDAESLARDSVQESSAGNGNSSSINKAMRQVWVYECYIKVDVDGDGIAEMRQVTVAGPGYEILRNEAWDAPKPFVSISPIILPHRFVGMALADITKIWQLLRSTVLRQYLDNLYLSNNQREEVDEKRIVDVDEVMSHKPGQKIRTKNGNGPAIIPIVVPQIGAQALEGLNYLDQLKENATAISSRTQGLGADKLHDTAAGEQILMTAAMGRIELIARSYAEGVKEAFRLIHKLVCMYQDQPRTVRLTGKEFVPIDPSSWNADMDMTVSVGLGTGDQSQQQQAAMLIGAAQEKLIQAGMVKPEHLLNTMEMLVNATGQKGVDRFASLPDPNAPPQPDPEMAKVQAKAQADQASAQMDAQLKSAQMQQDMQMQSAKMQQDAQQAQIDAQIQAQRLQQEGELKKYQIDSELELKRQQLQAELMLKREQMAAEIELKRELGKMQAANDSADIGNVAVGGDPG